jgi:A118 family predicted phage portal protein
MSVWLKLFGKKLPRKIVEGDNLINYWRDIYTGEPKWKTYTTQGLSGKKTNYRFLMNGGKMLCQELAGLVFAEPPTFGVDDDVRELLDKNRFNENGRVWLEYALALGSGVLKWLVKDGELVIDWVQAGDFIPVSYDSRGVYEADFLSTTVHDDKEFKVIEQHRQESDGYRISLEVYENIGNDDFRKVDPGRAGLEQSEWIVPTKMFEVWKTPVANSVSMGSPFGMSIFGTAVDTIQQLDMAGDYLTEEIITSGRKIIIGHSMLQRHFPSSKNDKPSMAYYDKNEKVYVAFDDAEKESMQPTAINFDLRIDEITQTINTLLAILSKQSGCSDSFLSLDGKSMKTATEVISENSKTFRMKKNIENSLTYTILNFLDSLKIIGAECGIKTTNMEYYIDWDDSVIEDRNSRANYWNTRVQAGTGLLEDALIELDGLSEEEAVIKAKQIRDSRAVVDVGLWGDE